MLGLGSSLFTVPKAYHLVNTYTSDFTNTTSTTGNASSADGALWSSYSVDQGNLLKETNQTVDGSSGWMKFTYSATQTSSSGITSSLDSFAWQATDIHEISFNAYFDGDWDGSDTISTYCLLYTSDAADE